MDKPIKTETRIESPKPHRKFWSRFVQKLGEVIGQIKFGGGGN